MLLIAKRFSLFAAALAFITALAPMVQAADVSLVSGLYKNEKWKNNGTNAGGKSEMSAGGRYHDDLSTHVGWFALGGLSLKSYEAGDGGKAPDNSTGIRMGGGLRLYFSPFAQSAVPFVAATGSYINDKDTTYEGGFDYKEIERSGLYYGGSVGLRLGLNEEFFMEFESNIFESALYANEKRKQTRTTTVNGVSTTTSTDGQTTKMELFAQTGGSLLGSTTLALGMKL